MFWVWAVICAACNACFHALTKLLPKLRHPFASLTISFSVAAVSSFVCLLLFEGGENISGEFFALNWLSVAIGVILFGTETCLYYLYREGASMTSTPLIIAVVETVLTITVAIVLFRENPTWVNYLGLLMGLLGTYFAGKETVRKDNMDGNSIRTTE